MPEPRRQLRPIDASPWLHRGADWHDDAACRGHDPELWFTDRPGVPAEKLAEPAKKVCARCPVTGACLTWALANDEKWGVWGGLTAEERRELRNRSA